MHVVFCLIHAKSVLRIVTKMMEHDQRNVNCSFRDAVYGPYSSIDFASRADACTDPPRPPVASSQTRNSHTDEHLRKYSPKVRVLQRDALAKRLRCSGAHLMTNEKAEEVQEALWSGFLPLKVQVEDDGMESSASLPPLYLQAPRQAPVGAIQEQVLHLLGEGLPAGSVALTFWDTHQVHLNSNYPLGVVYDLLESGEIPWKLTVKCTRDHQGDEARDQFFNALKAASYAATGSAQHVITMPTAEANKLWDACRAGKRQEYKDAATSFHDKMENAQRFLVRVFCRRNKQKLDSDRGWSSKHIESKLKVVAAEKEGLMQTRQALKDWLQVDTDLETARLTIAGIPFPLELSLVQLWRLLRAPDYTLYIVVRWP